MKLFGCHLYHHYSHVGKRNGVHVRVQAEDAYHAAAEAYWVCVDATVRTEVALRPDGTYLVNDAIVYVGEGV